MPKTGLFAAKTLEHRKRPLSHIRHFRREIGNGTVLHALSLAVMHAGGKLALRRSSALVRRARPASIFCARPPNLPTASTYRRASQLSLTSGRCLLRLSVLRLPQPRRQRQGHPALLARFRARLVVKPACRAVTWHGERAHNPFALPAPNASVAARHTCHPFRKKPPPADEPG